MSGFTRAHIIGFVEDLFFSTPGERTQKCPDSPVHTLSGSLRIYFFPLWRANSKMSGFTRGHIIGFVEDLFFSTLEIGLKNVRIRPSTHYRVRWGFIFFHSGDRTQKCPDSPVHTLSGSLTIYFFPLWRADSKMSGFTRAHIIGFVEDLFFSTLEIGL